jgi:hypothetical protein
MPIEHDDPKSFSDPEEPKPMFRADRLAKRGGGVGETHAAYPRVVAVLAGGRRRVIVCPAGMQRIVQTWHHPAARGQWASQSFCRTRAAFRRQFFCPRLAAL